MLFAHGSAMAADRGKLELALRWMNFDDVSSYRIVERWGSHLRWFYGAGGGGGIHLQAAAHGESNPQEVFSGVEGQNGVAASS
jgi:hypothetical protein